MGVDWLAYGYATLVASGGIIGYAKAGKLQIRKGTLFCFEFRPD